MSDGTKPQREWRFYINDMIGFAEKVLRAWISRTSQQVASPAMLLLVALKHVHENHE